MQKGVGWACSMKEIKLNQGKITIVDDEDFERLNQYRWIVNANKKNIYVRRYTGLINGISKYVLMHREIVNAPKHMQVDHINGNSLDNRKTNLRLCSNKQNNYNKKNPNKSNKLKIKGVYFHNKKKKFIAQIQIDKKNIHLGQFNVLGDADSAYRKAEDKYYGKFSRNLVCHY